MMIVLTEVYIHFADMLKHRQINNVFGENVCVCKSCTGSVSSTPVFTRGYRAVNSTKVIF